MVEAVQLACDKAGIHIEFNGPTEIHDMKIELPSNNRRLALIDIKSMWHAFDEASSGAQVAALFEHVAEPFLAEDYRTADGSKSVPVFITEYPKDICPLARPNDADPKVCDRFELFIEGRELANAFQELNDPVEQAARFQEQLENNHKDPMDYDADYVEALEHGMPPAIGFGMGIDRLVMLLTNTTSIKDVILFPTLKPVKTEHVRDPISQTETP
jgi:lysyl-tRNA synthetase class II